MEVIEIKELKNVDIENVKMSIDLNQDVVILKIVFIFVLYEISKNVIFVIKYILKRNMFYLLINEYNIEELLFKNMDKFLDLEINNGDEEFMNDFIVDLDRIEMVEVFQKFVNFRFWIMQIVLSD